MTMSGGGEEERPWLYTSDFLHAITTALLSRLHGYFHGSDIDPLEYDPPEFI